MEPKYTGTKFSKNYDYKPKKLMIVAHPDDETIFGGKLLINQPNQWKVLVLTNASHKKRKKELAAAMDFTKTSFEMWDHKDHYKPGFNKKIAKDIEDLVRENDFVEIVSHNSKGEYGHPQHKETNKVAREIAKKYSIPFGVFGKGEKISKKDVDKKIKMFKKAYKTQSEEWTKIPWFGREKITYKKLSLKKCQIPKIIHELWVGGKIPNHKKLFIDHNKKMAKMVGWDFYLWTNKDLTPKKFPITYPYIQKSIESARLLAEKEKKEKKVSKQRYDKVLNSRWAQVSDLMRLEIIYTYGGFYLDTNVEIIRDLNELYSKIDGNFTMVVANQEPCGLDCNDGKGKYYISNGFFGATKGNMMLKKALSKKNLDKINFDRIHINQETGPYYFRKFINPKKTLVLGQKSIYPFFLPEWYSEYIDDEEKESNRCIKNSRKEAEKNKGKGEVYAINTCFGKQYLIHPCKEYEDSFMMNHAIGGSWGIFE
jgi:mannosyltransferase OCH1-like enzyme